MRIKCYAYALGLLLQLCSYFAFADTAFDPNRQSADEVFATVREAVNYSRENRNEIIAAAEVYATQTDDLVLSNKLMRSRSVSSLLSGNREEGLDWAKQAYDHAVANSLGEKEIMHCLNMLGQANSNLGNVYEAIRLYHEANDIARKAGDAESIFSSGIMESNLYIKLQRLDDAMAIMNEMKAYYAEYSVEAHKLIYAHNYADCLFVEGKYDEVVSFIEEMVGFENTTGNILRTSLRLLYAMSVIEDGKTWDPEKGDLPQLLEELELSFENESPSRALFLNWMYLSRVWVCLEDYDNADRCMSIAESVFDFEEESGLARNVAETRAKISFGLGEYEEAWSLIHEFIRLDDVVRNEAVLKRIETLREEHQARLKNDEIERLNLENQLSRRSIESQKMAIVYGIIFTVFLAAICVLIFLLWGREKRHLEIEKSRVEEVTSINVKLKEAEANKDYFLAVTSHELRNPLNGIVGILGLLKDKDLGEEMNQLVELAADSGASMSNQIDEILDYAKLESGKFEIVNKEFDVLKLAESVVGLFQSKAHASGLKLALEIVEATPEKVESDSFRVRQILSNFISNSLKFTESGTITLRIAPVAGGTGLEQLKFEVEDHGIGMDEAEMSRLFQPFQQASTDTVRKYGGTGLGLSICSRLAELMGGDIGVESEKGEGSVFWFTIPLT